MASSKKSRFDWGGKHKELKERTLVEAAELLRAHNVPFDRVEFICSYEEEDHDALVYVWNGNGARTCRVTLRLEEPTGADSPADKKAAPEESAAAPGAPATES